MDNLLKSFLVVTVVFLFLVVVHEGGHAIMVKTAYGSCNPKIWFGIAHDGFYTEYNLPSSCLSNVGDFKVAFAGFWMESVIGLLVSSLLVLFLFSDEVLNYGFGNSWRFWVLLIVLSLSLLMLSTFLFYINPFHATL